MISSAVYYLIEFEWFDTNKYYRIKIRFSFFFSFFRLLFQLCTSLETANKLVQSTNSNVGLLSEKVEGLEKIVRRGDSAVAAARAIHVSLNQKGGPFNGSQNV